MGRHTTVCNGTMARVVTDNMVAEDVNVSDNVADTVLVIMPQRSLPGRRRSAPATPWRSWLGRRWVA